MIFNYVLNLRDFQHIWDDGHTWWCFCPFDPPSFSQQNRQGAASFRESLQWVLGRIPQALNALNPEIHCWADSWVSDWKIDQSSKISQEPQHFHLVGGFKTPLKNMRVSWICYFNIWKHENVPNHQPTITHLKSSVALSSVCQKTQLVKSTGNGLWLCHSLQNGDLFEMLTAGQWQLWNPFKSFEYLLLPI